MFIIPLQTARGILNSLICVVHFSNHFNSEFHKKGSCGVFGRIYVIKYFFAVLMKL